MQDTLAPWTGEPFSNPGVAPATISPAEAASTPPSGRVRRWTFRIGREGIAIASIVEHYGSPIHAPAAIANDRRPAGALIAVTAVAGGLALLMVGASAGRAWSPALSPVDSAMIVPAATPVAAVATPARASAAPAAAATRSAPAVSPATPGTNDTTAFIPGMSRSDAIGKALATGEFQEWAERDGTTGFAVAGPAEAGSRGACRALAVLTRKPDGSDAVASSRECRAVSARD